MLRFLYIILFGFLFIGCNQKDVYTAECCVKRAESATGMVVTAHPLATDAGIAILEKGGNAFDAAIAVHFALTVVYPRAGNIAGGGFMVARDSEGMVTSLDFRETAPENASRDMYLDEAGEPIPGRSQYGGMAAGIPGAVAGMHAIHERYGSLEWNKLLDLSISMAKHGVELTAGEASIINEYLPKIKANSITAGPFGEKAHWNPGDILRQPILAETLAQIAEKGAEIFYSGAMAESIVEGVNQAGGIFSLSDMQSYTPVWREPAKINFGDYTVFAMDMPSSGGLALSQILRLLEMMRIDTTQFQSPEAVQKMIEVSRIAYADRSIFPGDPKFVNIPFDELTNADYLHNRIREINWETAISSTEFQAGNILPETEETTHFTVADKWGNVVAITTTLNSNFGACLYLPEQGIFINNEMDDFSIKPGVPNQFGLIGAEANKIEPGKRMLSSMTPVIIEKQGNFYASIGTPGGATIITSIMQVFLNAAVFGMEPEEAVQAPRFHYQWLPDTVRYEQNALIHSKEVLADKGYLFKERASIGKVEAIFAGKNGNFIGVADTRGEDHAAGLPE